MKEVEERNQLLLEAERQTASELGQRLIEISTRGKQTMHSMVERELLQVRGWEAHSCWEGHSWFVVGAALMVGTCASGEEDAAVLWGDTCILLLGLH